MPLKLAFLLSLLIVHESSAAELTSWQLPVRLSYGYGTAAGEAAHAYLELEPSASASLSSAVRVEWSARARLDRENKLEPGEPGYETWSNLSRPVSIGDTGTLALRDAYVEIELPNGLARIGKQQIVWGRLDGIKVLDVLNPQSFREFILEDFGHSRIGLWSAYTDMTFGEWRVELALIPDDTGHEVPAEGAWFQLTAPRFRYGAPPGQAAPPMTILRDRNHLEVTAASVQLSRFVGSVGMELKALLGQVNPHFLFNALGSILAVSDDTRSVRELTLALSEYLRLSLQRRGDQEPLENELSALEGYLHVEKVRFEDRLQFLVNVDDESRRTLTPYALIQPLLENAIKYGQQTSVPPLRVRVEAHVTEGTLVLQVSNSGHWFPPTQSGTTGTGLANLRRRLDLLYQGMARLDIETEGGEVRVMVRLPAVFDQQRPEEPIS